MRCSNTYNVQKQSLKLLWKHGMMFQGTPTLHKEVLGLHTHNSTGNGKSLEQNLLSINNQLMHLQPICWQYQGKAQCLWLGKTNGLLAHIKVYITSTIDAIDEYQISSTINGFTNQRVIGIENAKTKAQDLLNSYAISLILP